MTDTFGSDDDGSGGIPTWTIVLIVVVVGIPVLLMMTVILAAVIGAFVLGFGSGAIADAPTAEWGTADDPDAGTVTFTLEGNATIERDRLAVTVDGESWSNWESSASTLERGGTVEVTGLDPGQEVELYWETDGTRELLAFQRVST